MSHALHTAAGLLLCLLFALSAQAEVVGDLYLGEVPVADRSQASLNAAAREALAQVLVKVSGSREVLDNPEVVPVLADARELAQQFSYARGRTPEQSLLARFEFDNAWVNGLLAGAGEPIWTANRPAVLLWLVRDTPAGRQFVTSETAPEEVEILRAAFARRGVPLRMPLHDLADAAALPAAQAWQLNPPSLRQASARYRVEEILAGRVSRLSSGDWLGDWSYLSSRDRVDRSATAEPLADFLQAGADLVAEEMASRYAIAASATAAGGVSMRVTNVRAYADYAAVVSWLEGLELIERANVEQISGDTLQLRLQAQADAGQLAAIIELNRQLVPQTAARPIPGELSYRWQN